ncbi:MAG: pectate lyase, partial [Bacteroidales bacterium]|nr:pectate lyase [Bacteroidales bacterium]
YPNGGFRQFSRDYGYYTHITYNDDAMVNVLYFIKAMQEGGSDADPNLFDGLVTDDLKSRLADAFDRGIQCILATQFVQNGVKTVWCAQHDENTLLPAQARSYELPSLSGAESVGIVRLLMEQPGPDARIREAVNAAMAWFDKTRITDKRVETFINEDGVSDRRLADRTPGTGSDIWGRFYELDTNRPFVCDRDGIVKYDMKDIGHERRNGYSWYTSSPERLFPLYDAWKKKWGIN